MYLGKNTNVLNATREAIRAHCQRENVGREDVADELGITKGTLDNKLKPSMPMNTFTVEEILKLSDVCDDNSIIKAICEERGLVVFDPIEAMPDGGNLVHSLMLGALTMEGNMGRFADAVRASVADDEISTEEATQLTRLLRDLRTLCRVIELSLREIEA